MNISEIAGRYFKGRQTFQEGKRSKKLPALGAVLFAALLGLFVLIGVLLVRFETERHQQQELETVQQTLDDIRISLTGRIYSNIYKTSAVKALVAMNPDLTQDDFSRAMEAVFEGEHDLRNIGLAKDMILVFMHPIEGNEAAVGLDYTTLPDQLEAVNLAQKRNEIVLAGPLTLVQGGEGVIARIPIYIPGTAADQEEFWGFASVVMNSEAMLTAAGITESHDTLRMALRGRDGLGAEGDIFWGDPEMFQHNPVTLLIDLPYGNWQIAALPAEGWSSYSMSAAPLIWVYATAVFTILAFTVLIIFLLNKVDKTAHERSIFSRSLEVLLNQTNDFVYFKDSRRRFVFCSQTMADITNHRHWKDMVGKHNSDIFAPALAEMYGEEEEPVFRDGKPLLNKVNPYYSASGETGYIQTSRWPVFDEQNNVNGIFGIGRDVTEPKKAIEALEQERNLFVQGPVFTIKWEPKPFDNLPVRNVSSNVEQILGYSPAEMLGAGFSYSRLIHPDDREAVIDRLKHNVENNIDSFEDSYRLRTKAGQYLWLYEFTELVRGEEGIVTAVRSYLYDQSAQKAAEEALRIAEERLKQTAYELTENIPIGTYTMVQPPEGGMAKFVFMSRRFLELSGLTREEAAEDPMKAFACVHPDDFAEWVGLNARAFEERSAFFGETRVVVDGEIRWVAAESTPRLLPDGSTVWEGVLADITDRKRAEEALLESLSRFNDLVAHVSVGVYVFWIRSDGRMEFEFVSDLWCSMNKVSREDVLANWSVAFDIVHPDDQARFRSLNQEAVREQKRFYWEGRMVADGKVFFAQVESTPVFFDNGDSRWFGVQQDITHQKQALAEVEYMSFHDVLTGLYNRRFYQEELKRLDVPENLPFSLIMIDVNGLKLMNDAFGHTAGDTLLITVAEVLRSVSGHDDIVARIGGDEFAVLLPGTDENQAQRYTERLLEAMAARTAAGLPLSVSGGWATKTDPSTGIEVVFREAEDCMYRSKMAKRSSYRYETVQRIIQMLYEKAPREQQHSLRVGQFCQTIGAAMGMSRGKIKELTTAGKLHDIGKIAMNESIFDRASTLTASGRSEKAKHPEAGYSILSAANDYAAIAESVLSHHEWWDGTGYPNGLQGEAIPLNARIIAIADAYDALVSRKPDGETMSHFDAVAEIQSRAGSQFDPQIVKVFVARMQKGETASADSFQTVNPQPPQTGSS